jgi:ribonuclease HI
MSKSQEITVFTDGGSRGNPGPAAAGYLVLSGDSKLFDGGEYLGIATNNVAEYHALDRVLKLIIENKIKGKTLKCFLDSELIVRQIMGLYKIKKAHLKNYYQQIQSSILKLRSLGYERIEFKHVKREHNKEADALVNSILDKRISNN